MKVGLNLLHAHPGIGGGWEYIRCVVNALAAFGGHIHFIAYCTKSSAIIVPEQANFTCTVVAIRGTNRIARIAYEQTLLQMRALRDGLDCMHWFANTLALLNAVPAVVTFYDLNVYENPRNFPLAYRLYLKTMIPLGAYRSKVPIAISKKTANDLHVRFGIDKTRICVVPSPVGEDFRPYPDEEVEEFREKYGLPKKYWLYVAHCYPHKNHERLLRGYSELVKNDPCAWPLVLRGERFDRADEYAALVNSLGIEERVTWLPRIASGEMPLLYCAAGALVFPSTYEGLGIPVIEAMACGLAVVASDIPTNREFADGVALFFDPTEDRSISLAMSKIMTDDMLRAESSRNGSAAVKDLRPERIAAELMAAYERACGVEVSIRSTINKC